ncbi:serine protease [Luteolibacter flavescens]|uniref:Serine protease n=1 Tax=Luteolibacter flavescens TaxID=1859460 RepID=A0ABT3FP94_9BACT|nr:serine protease [Luteolibacter flavescens]MCW1885402.1 serine protease [Luteolibacter flavescens]
MFRIVSIAALVVWAASAVPSLADKHLVMESRHPTAKERRAGRAKIEAELEKEGFGPVPRVVGGRAAADGEYPWMVGILDAGEPDEFDAHFCGGSLIHPYWVLTAAHCVLGSRAEDLDVLVGATDLSNPGGDARRIAVTEIILSPTYNTATMDADYALLRLAEPADGTVIPLIDDRSQEIPGVLATVTGWGTTSAGSSSYPNRLQEVELPLVDLAVANATPVYSGTLTQNMLPAGVAAGGKDACYGDSGGPLIVPSPHEPGWMQAGVVSFGAGCAKPGAYGIYTRIGNFRDFITGHIRPNYAAWERANGRSGENLDPDGDGWTNFEEWALPDGGVIERTVVDNYLRIRYLRPNVAPEADYILEHAATDAGPWSPVAARDWGMTRLDDVMILSAWRLPLSADHGVYRVRVEISRDFVPGNRPLAFPGTATGQLGSQDRRSQGQIYQTYALDFPPGTGRVAISLRSTDFKAMLRIQGLGAGGTIVDIDGNQGIGVGGTDEWHEFTPEGGRRYRVWVTTTDSGEAGRYQLNVFDPLALAAMPPLAAPRAKPLVGTLAGDELPDPFFLPGSFFFKDDYRLDLAALPAGRLLEVRMTSKGRPLKEIDDFLSLIDGESGQMIAANDNFAGKKNDAGLRFLPVPGKTYLLRTSSAVERDVGTYQLAATSPVPGAKKSPLGGIGIGSSVSGKLTGSSELDDRYATFKYDYLLDETTADQRVAVTLESAKFDAYLTVLDASDLTVVTEGDSGGPDGVRDNARVEFLARAGHRYFIRATTYERLEKGPFILKTSAAP